MCYTLAERQSDTSFKRVTLPIKKRVRLGELCVKKIMPLWQPKTDYICQLRTSACNVLTLISAYLYTDTSEEELGAHFNKYEKMCEEAEYYAPLPRAENHIEDFGDAVPFFHAIQVLAVRVFDDEYWIYDEMERKEDGELEPDEEFLTDSEAGIDEELHHGYHDAEYIASLAYAMDNEGYYGQDKDKLKEFWLWYINEAVPSVLCADTIEEATKQEETK